MRKNRNLRAFSLLEIMIASALSAVFAFIVISSIISITNLSSNLYKESSVQQSARLVLDITSRSIRNAVPLYSCLDTPLPTKLGGCKILKSTPPEASSAFIKASSNEAYFFSYGTRTDGSNDIPDLVQINFEAPVIDSTTPASFKPEDNYKICVTTYKPLANSTTFTAWRTGSNTPITANDLVGKSYNGVRPPGADLSATGVTRICAGPVGFDTTGIVKTLQYRTASNCYYGQGSCMNLSEIKQVELNIVLSYTNAKKQRLLRPLQAFINVGSANLGGS